MVVIVTRLPAGHPRDRNSISDKERNFSFRQSFQVASGAQLFSGYPGLSRWGLNLTASIRC